MITPFGGSRPNWRAWSSQEPRRCSQPVLQIVQAAYAGHGVGRVYELQHFGALQLRFLGVEYIGDAVGRERQASDHRLRDGSFGGFFGKAAEIGGHRVHAIGIKLEFQGVGTGQAGVGFADNLAQAVAVGQRQIQKFHQARQFGRHFDGGSGQHQGSSIGGEFLAYVAQTAHHYRVIHVAMEVFQHEDGLDGHGLEVRQRLHGVGGVVHGGLRPRAGIGTSECVEAGLRPALAGSGTRPHTAAGADQAVGDGPFKDG